MKYDTYFLKRGEIYGISEKYSFGHWRGYVVKFNSLEKAVKWLNTEQYDFRYRSLVSKTAAIKSGYKMPEHYYGEHAGEI